MSTIRERTEEIERLTLAPSASLSCCSKGRRQPEPDDDLRTCFQRDRDRIIHSKAFRRLKHKTQVFLAPKGDHYRTRLTHVLEVAQIARTIARALRLNEDLTEAISLGHDLGHTPFGHAGEQVLRELVPWGFDHYKQSLRVVDLLEKDGRGLNLTEEVRDGIIKHSKGMGRIIPERGRNDGPATLEGTVVRISDVIAYVNHDLDDALRAGVLNSADIPERMSSALGSGCAQRIDTMVRDVVAASTGAGVLGIGMSEAISETVDSLRKLLFERVYESDAIKDEFRKAKGVLRALYEYFFEHPENLTPAPSAENLEERHRMICDFIAGMTDGFALMTYERIFMPQQWTVL